MEQNFETRAARKAATQLQHPWRTTIRTVIQVIIPGILALGVLAPEVVRIILEESGQAMPDGIRGALLGVAAVLATLAAIVTRIMALPKVDVWLSKARLSANPENEG